MYIQMTNCDICDYKFNTQCRQIKCFDCEYIACHKCYRKYIEINDKIEINCVSCFKTFKDEDFFKQMPKNYKKLNQLRIGDLLYKKLTPNMDIFDEWVAIEKSCRLKQQDINEQNDVIKNMRRQIQLKVWDMKEDLFKMCEMRRNAVKTIIGDKCCVANCIGLTNTYNICRKCAVETCIVCKCEKTADHSCDVEQIETLKFIKENSISCPCCAIPISKIDGCDDMFCVSCHTKFKYNSGEIIHNKIHNPHLEAYDNSTVLNECEPINRPPYEMLFPKSKPNDKIVIEYRQVVGGIFNVYSSVETVISQLRSFISKFETDKRRYGCVVRSIITPNAIKSHKQYLVEEMKEVEVKTKLLGIMEIFLGIITDILWYVAEQNPKNHEVEKICLEENDFKLSYERYDEAFEWVCDAVKSNLDGKITSQICGNPSYSFSIKYQCKRLLEDGLL